MSQSAYGSESQGPETPGSPRAGARKRDDGCCEAPITIDNKGTVNISVCSAAPAEQPQPVPEEPEEGVPTLPPEGACVPLALGSKPKRSLEAKLRPLLENTPVPSVLPAAFFQMARRYLRGRSPANGLESAAFDVFEGLSPELRRMLACSLRIFDALPLRDQARLFAPELTGDGDRPVEPERLAQLVSDELLRRAGLEAFGDEDGISEERPGQLRLIGGGGGDDVGPVIFVNICRVNGLRTDSFSPTLSLGEYTPDEVQQQCTLEVVNGQVQTNCQVQTEDCPGNEIEGTCLRVPEVRNGEAVTLQGVNFFNTDARVRLEAKPPGSVSREVEAHVVGDVTTPVTETVDGFERTIADCRVEDILTFRIPGDLPPGIYGITVIVPNNTGLSGFGDEIESPRTQFIRVVPPDTATFQIASETLDAVKETSPAFFGSDEVGIRVLVIPIAPDLTPGDVIEHNFEFGDVDSGESRAMSRTLFQQSNVGGVSLSIVGFEIDDRDVFEKQIQDFADAYVEILRSNWNAIAGGVGATGGLVALALGLSNAWATAIAAAVTLAINIFVALWAPADLIIEDAAAFTALDLGSLTSANFPAPEARGFTSAGGIDVRIEPVSKGVQYTERREYRSGEEDSEYHITLRYNRF